MITRLGALSLGAAIPAVPLAIAQLTACLAPLLADESKLAAAIANPLTLPNVADYIAALEAAIANAAAALTNIPSLTITLKASLSVQIGVLAGLIAAAQALLSSLSGAVSAGGFYGYAYSGSASSIGAELQAALATDIPPATPGTMRALVLATMDAGAWASAGVLLKTS